VKNIKKKKTIFSIISLILTSDTLEYYTDGENYLICRSNPNTPIWVWNKDSISEEIVNEILTKLDNMLDKERVIQITSKEVIFKRLMEKYKDIVVDNYFMQKGNYLQMRAYECNNLIKPKNIIGYKERPSYDDIELLAYFKKCDIEDTIKEEYAKEVTQEQLLETAKKHIDNSNFYVWKVDKKIVATAGYIDNRVSMVFTNREDRGNGYAGMLCYELCEELISQSKTPMLYADADYIPSNRAYQKIGFEEVGILYNVKIGKAKLKKLER
jgi:ribosomal protein S18 acetylase RimI-like enzyme